MRHWEAFDCVYNSGIRHTPYYEGLKGLGEGARAARIIDPHTNLYSSRKLYRYSTYIDTTKYIHQNRHPGNRLLNLHGRRAVSLSAI